MKLLLICAFFLGCTKVHDLTQDKKSYFLNDINTKVDHYEVIDWHAGLQYEKILSKGIVITSKLIELSTEAKETLSKKFMVDSWLYHFYRINKEGEKVAIGWAAIPFDLISRSFSQFGAIIYYHSAYLSAEFRDLKCPAFNHRKKIESIKLINSGKSLQKLLVNKMESVKTDINSGLYSPIIFDGGKELIGEYHVEVALYSSSLRVTYSEWIKLKNSVHITKESDVSLVSCKGINEENNSRLKDSTK